MKNICFLLIIAVLMTAGCNQKIETESVDLSAVNDIVIALDDTYMNAWNAKDIDVLDEMIADDGMFFGTDPTELMDKTALMDMYTQLFAETDANYSYNIDIRKIKLAEDGKSAIVVDYIDLYDWSPLIPLRHTSQFVKTGNDWKIDFIAWGLIAKNEDIDKLNKALE